MNESIVCVRVAVGLVINVLAMTNPILAWLFGTKMMMIHIRSFVHSQVVIPYSTLIILPYRERWQMIHSWEMNFIVEAMREKSMRETIWKFWIGERYQKKKFWTILRPRVLYSCAWVKIRKLTCFDVPRHASTHFLLGCCQRHCNPWGHCLPWTGLVSWQVASFSY